MGTNRIDQTTFVPPEVLSTLIPKMAPLQEEEMQANACIEVFKPTPQFMMTPIQTRPKLESPKMVDRKAMETSTKEINLLVERIEEENDISRKEALLGKMLIESYHAQSANREEDGKVSLQTVTNNQKANKELQKEYFKNVDNLIERSKAGEVLGWIQFGMTGAMIIGGIVTLAAVIFSGGSAIPAIIAAWTGAAAVGTGTAGISQGIMQFQKYRVRGVISELQAFRELNKEKISHGLSQMKESVDFIANNWSALRKVLDEMQEAALNQLK